MNKNVILIVAGAVDTFLNPNSRKSVDNCEKLKNNITEAFTKNNYKAVINLTNQPKTTVEDLKIFKEISPSKLVDFTLQSDQFFHQHNLMTIPTHDGSNEYLFGNQFDYIFPSEKYEVHLCGVDLHGIFKDTISTLLEKGYSVTVYSDVLRPFKSTHKYINSVIKETKFHYCSFRSVGRK